MRSMLPCSGRWGLAFLLGAAVWTARAETRDSALAPVRAAAAEDECLRCFDRFVRAATRDNVAELESLLDDGFLLLNPDGSYWDKAMVLADARAGGSSEVTSAVPSDRIVRVDRDTAFVTAEVAITEKSVREKEHFRASLTLVRSRGTWRVLAATAARPKYPFPPDEL